MNNFFNNFKNLGPAALIFSIVLLGSCASTPRDLPSRFINSRSSSLAEQKWISENVKGLENINHNQLASWKFVVHSFWPFLESFDRQDSHIKSYLAQNHYPIFRQDGLLIQILKENQTIADVSDLSYLKGKKLSEIYGKSYENDKRTIDQLGGEASHRLLIIKSSRIPEAPHGMYNTLYHEFAHLIHQTGFTRTQLDKLELLYEQAKRQNIFYDDYAASNSAEYFACSVEAFLSETKSDKSWHGYAEERLDLIKRDPQMANFISDLITQ